MDPVVIAAGTGIVEAIAGDTWQQVREAVAGLWRRVRSHDVDGVCNGAG